MTTRDYRAMATRLRSMRGGVQRLSDTLDRAIDAIDGVVASPDDLDAQTNAFHRLQDLRKALSAVPIPTHPPRGDQWT